MRLLIRDNLIIIVLLLSLTSPAIVSGQSHVDRSLDQAVLKLFAGYPYSDDLRRIVHSHARRPRDQVHVVFYSTWFLDGNVNVPMGTIIGNNGRVTTFARNRWKELPHVDLPTFMTTVKALPETTPSVALANVVIVSFRTDGKWQTRVYDRSKPPKELLNVYRISQSPLDVY